MAETTISLLIEGMTCTGCAQGIQQALKRQKGVIAVDVDWRRGTGDVRFDAAATSAQDILDHPIFDGHYRARPKDPGCCA